MARLTGNTESPMKEAAFRTQTNEECFINYWFHLIRQVIGRIPGIKKA